VGLLATAQAQTVSKSLEAGGTDAAMRVRKNHWTVRVVGGQLSGTYMTFADELAQVLDDGDNLRVIPIVAYGAASNFDDLLYLQQVDVAVTQSTPSSVSAPIEKFSTLSTRSITSFACPFPRCMSSQAPILRRSKTFGARKSVSGRLVALPACLSAAGRPGRASIARQSYRTSEAQDR
jgi:hypothetical protein